MPQPRKPFECLLPRRQFLLAALLLAAGGNSTLASTMQKPARQKRLSWAEFEQQMQVLAERQANTMPSLARPGADEVAEQGLLLLARLDIEDAGFKAAVAQSYESGNRFWLWQRLLKASNLNGGILNIDTQLVAMHDHPGAVGMVRIISGEAEVWQYDETGHDSSTGLSRLQRVSHKRLGPGDLAVLTPQHGNIHALRAVEGECRMLDFFIPPYRRGERHWFEPLHDNWESATQLSCRRIPQHEYHDV